MLAGAIIKNGIEIVVVTDHNTTKGIKKLQMAVSIIMKNYPIYDINPHILHGVEISAADKLHIVCIYDYEQESWVNQRWKNFFQDVSRSILYLYLKAILTSKSPKKVHGCICICRCRLRIGKMNTTINIYLRREQLNIVLLFLFSGGKMTKELQSSRYIVISFLVSEMGIDIVEAISLMAELEKNGLVLDLSAY